MGIWWDRTGLDQAWLSFCAPKWQPGCTLQGELRWFENEQSQ